MDEKNRNTQSRSSQPRLTDPGYGRPRPEGSSRNVPPEEDQRYSRRATQANYAQQRQQKKRKKRTRIVVAVAVVLLAVVLGSVGAAFAYYNGISNNLHEGVTDDLKDVLVKSEITKEPFYMLLMGTDKSKDREASGELDGIYRSDSLILARIDPVSKKVTLVSLHRDTLIDMGANGQQKLNAAYSIGGAAYTVETVSKLAGVPISHYAEINFNGFKDIVDALGGIEVDVPMEIDDPDAGGHVSAGLQTLNGDQALILCRARHAYDEYGDGDVYRAANQRLVIGAIAKKILSADLATMANTVSALSRYMTTDLEVSDVVALAQTLRGLDTSKDIYSAMEPTTSTFIDGDGWYEYCNTAAWKAMMKRVDQGLPPTEADEVDSLSGTVLANTGDGKAGTASSSGGADAHKATPGGKKTGTILVKNGSGADGVASAAASKLTPQGYAVETGNADGFDYPETIVVYNSSNQANEAKEIANALGIGKAQVNDGTFSFAGDFLVVVGSDWQ
ncbi:MAG: LCP family protein [Raoultibacter sp.]